MKGTTTNPTSTKATGKEPTHDVKLKRVSGERTSWERIGAGWQRNDGSIYVKLIGTQLVSEGFNIYPVEAAQ